MRIKKKELKRLIERFLLEADEPGMEDIPSVSTKDKLRAGDIATVKTKKVRGYYYELNMIDKSIKIVEPSPAAVGIVVLDPSGEAYKSASKKEKRRADKNYDGIKSEIIAAQPEFKGYFEMEVEATRQPSTKVGETSASSDPKEKAESDKREKRENKFFKDFYGIFSTYYPILGYVTELVNFFDGHEKGSLEGLIYDEKFNAVIDKYSKRNINFKNFSPKHVFPLQARKDQVFIAGNSNLSLKNSNEVFEKFGGFSDVKNAMTKQKEIEAGKATGADLPQIRSGDYRYLTNRFKSTNKALEEIYKLLSSAIRGKGQSDNLGDQLKRSYLKLAEAHVLGRLKMLDKFAKNKNFKLKDADKRIIADKLEDVQDRIESDAGKVQAFGDVLNKNLKNARADKELYSKHAAPYIRNELAIDRIPSSPAV